MEYKVFQDIKLSRLGMGNMRLPTTQPNGPIHQEEAQRIIDYVYEQGVNYFDTAYFYHNGQSELFLGEALKKFPRGSYFLADKLPSTPLREGRTVAEIFEEQLQKCQTDYFDFYLLHNVNEGSCDLFLDERVGAIPYLLEQKKAGRIRHLGFSSHSSPQGLKEFLRHWDGFEFVQIQLNYLDWTFQNAREQYDIITGYGVPVWVMEPCRGGRLASLTPDADRLLRGARPDMSIASWAFRWLQGLPNVQIVLSGMTNSDQAKDNIATFSAHQPLSPAEQDVLEQAVELLRREVLIPCTQCHYCDGCPQGLDIPKLLSMYSAYRLSGGRFTYDQLAPDARPDRCVSCGRCASKCPQNIDIPEHLHTYAQAMST